MNVQTYRTLPDAVKRQVDAIDKESFAWAYHQTPEDRAVGKDKFCSKGDSTGFVVVEEKEDVIGAVNLFIRRITFEDIKMNLGGIGGLCTRKDKRKNGVGTLLLTRAIEELRRARSDVAYLCTDVSKDWMVRFYQKAGFVRLKQGHTYTGKSGKRYTEFDGMVAPVCSTEKFHRIIMSEKALSIGRGNW